MEPTSESSTDDATALDATEGDRQLLDRHRADTIENNVRHLLGVPTQDAAEALAAVARNEAAEAHVEGPTDDAIRPWRVVAITAADDDVAAAAERRFTELAAEYGGRYEGSEAGV